MALYGFRSGPTYNGVSQADAMSAALDQPLGFGANLVDQAVGGALSSPGLGTAIRDIVTPEGTGEGPLSILDIGPFKSPLKAAVQYFINDETSPALTQETYKSSPFFRQEIPWDAGMTEDRAASLASWYDARKVREHFAEKRPISSFIGGMAGQAFDPVNYIPVAGPAVKAAAVARLGRVGGAALTGAVDAAANTAIAGFLTAPTRQGFGDDVSWQAQVSDIAVGAFIGSAFGTIGGVLEGRAATKNATQMVKAEAQLATLKTQQHARIALNEAIGAIAKGEDIALTPNAVEPMQRQADIQRTMPSRSATEAPEFQTWFEGSQVADEVGAPRVVYHGTGADIGSFDVSQVGTNIDPGFLGRGIYLTTKPETANYYAGVAGARTGNQSVMPLYASLRKPFMWGEKKQGLRGLVFRGERLPNEIHDEVIARTGFKFDPDKELSVSSAQDERALSQAVRDVLMEKGYDGVIARVGDQQEIVAFEPGQVKSVFNRGAFDRSDPRLIDNSPPRPEPLPEGRAEAGAVVAKREDPKATAAQYRIDAQTGAYDEQIEIDQVRTEGRLTEDDEAELASADEAFQNGSAYGEALQAAVGCLI